MILEPLHFGAFLLSKKKQKVHPDTTRNSQAQFCPSSSFGSMLQKLPNDQPKKNDICSEERDGWYDLLWFEILLVPATS